MDIDKLIEEIGKLEGEKLKKFQEALKKTNIDVKSQVEQVDLLTKAYNALGESTADALKAQKRFKDSQIDMANINLQVAKATNDYVKEVEAGAEMFELFQKIEEAIIKSIYRNRQRGPEFQLQLRNNVQNVIQRIIFEDTRINPVVLGMVSYAKADEQVDEA